MQGWMTPPRPISSEQREEQSLWEERDVYHTPDSFAQLKNAKPCECVNAGFRQIDERDLTSDGWEEIRECKKCKRQWVYEHEG